MTTRRSIREEPIRPATTYSPGGELAASTIGPEELNFRVRNGNGCFLFGIATGLIRSSREPASHDFELEETVDLPVAGRTSRLAPRLLRASQVYYKELRSNQTTAPCIIAQIGSKNTTKPHDRLVPVSYSIARFTHPAYQPGSL